MYAIIVTGQEVSSLYDEALITREGEEFIVCKGDFGPSGVHVGQGRDIPNSVLTFVEKEEAEAFAKNWEGHPWWVVPKSYRIVPVEPKYTQKLVGYERVM